MTTVRDVADVGELRAIERLFAEVWGRHDSPPVAAELMRAFAETDNYVSGAYDAGQLVGATVAFRAGADGRTLYSHITGVVAGQVGRGVGLALKQHQRAWALARGITAVEWTFDPLVARNAHFNVAKLGARPVRYLTNHYGVIGDAINRGDESDRLLVRWVLDEQPPAAPVSASRSRHVAVPEDVEGLRISDPDAAREWRLRVRGELAPLLASGGRIVGFERGAGYVVEEAG